MAEAEGEPYTNTLAELNSHTEEYAELFSGYISNTGVLWLSKPMFGSSGLYYGGGVWTNSPGMWNN